MGIFEKAKTGLKNFLTSKEHRTAAGVGLTFSLASMVTAVAVTAFIGIGNSVVMPVLLAIGASAVAMEVSFRTAYNDNFKIGTCLASAAATVGAAVLTFNAFYREPERRPEGPLPPPRAMTQAFEKSAAPRTFEAAATYRVNRPGIPATASPPAG